MSLFYRIVQEQWAQNALDGEGARLFGGNFGTRWLREYRNLALRLPSVVIPQEKSLLLNPRDPAMSDLKPGKAQAFSFDPRLVI
jgi:RES domain-containing protein